MSELTFAPGDVGAAHEQLKLPLSAAPDDQSRSRAAGWVNAALPLAQNEDPRDDEEEGEEWIERELEEYADAVSPAYCACERPLLMVGDDPEEEAPCLLCGHRVENGSVTDLRRSVGARETVGSACEGRAS